MKLCLKLQAQTLKKEIRSKMPKQSLKPIDGYINEIRELLPYSEKKMKTVLEELRRDVQDAMGSDKRPPSVVFGSPIEVAKNVSIAQDWGTKVSSWGIRAIASIIDYVIMIGLYVLFAFIRVMMSDAEPDWMKWHSIEIPLSFLLISAPIILFMLTYFIVLEKTYSTTIGKRIVGLTVVDESGIKITWTQSIIRNFSKVPFLSSFLLFDVLFGIISEKTRGRNQRVLDFVAGTNVIQQKQ